MSDMVVPFDSRLLKATDKKMHHFCPACNLSVAPQDAPTRKYCKGKPLGGCPPFHHFHWKHDSKNSGCGFQWVEMTAIENGENVAEMANFVIKYAKKLGEMDKIHAVMNKETVKEVMES